MDPVQLAIERRLLDSHGTAGRVGDVDRVLVVGDHAQHELQVDVEVNQEGPIGSKHQKEEWALDLVASRVLREGVRRLRAQPVGPPNGGDIGPDDLDAVIRLSHVHRGEGHADNLEIGVEIEPVEERERPIDLAARLLQLDGVLRDRLVGQLSRKQDEGIARRLDGNDVRLEGRQPHPGQGEAGQLVRRLDPRCARTLIAVFGNE